MISFKTQSIGQVGKTSVLVGGGTLIPYPTDEPILAGEYALVEISDGGFLIPTFGDYQEGDTSRLLLLVNGDFRISFLVPINSTLGEKVDVHVTLIDKEAYETMDEDLQFAALNAPIEPITPPPVVLGLPFPLDS